MCLGIFFIMSRNFCPYPLLILLPFVSICGAGDRTQGLGHVDIELHPQPLLHEFEGIICTRFFVVLW
jgi:hypothetical protein